MMTFRRRFTRTLLASAVAGLLAIAGGVATPAHAEDAPRRPGHVWVFNFENKNFADTWGPLSKAPYLSKTLRHQGNLLVNYYGGAHASLSNYLQQISGQGQTFQQQLDCPFFTDMRGVRPVLNGSLTGARGVVTGHGCVYPSRVRTISDQLEDSSRTWKAYMQSMETPCQHPVLDRRDTTQKATREHEYASRHNPFVYFHSIIDNDARCRSHVVNDFQLAADLSSIATTPNLSYVQPDLCESGHDAPCADGRPGGLVSADEYLRRTIPLIMNSPAYKKDGMIVITFDEAAFDSRSTSYHGTIETPLPGIYGPGGGRIGALVLSPFVKQGSTSRVKYNHYSLLGSEEDLFGLPRLGYAADSRTNVFGADVYNSLPPQS